jgi:peptidoglycan/xylan/chitin deacetylase (PgdA/CDA1 family)
MTSAKQVVRSFSLHALKTAAATVDRVRPPGRGVVVLAYHCVGGGTGLEIDLSPAAFEEQMAYLAARGGVIGIDELLPALAQGPTEGPDPVVVTFDDGTADFAEHAVPAMARYGIPSTLYLATDFVERGAPFPYGGRPLSWPALADACATGLVTVGSHTHGHAVMDSLDRVSAEYELDRSTGLIQDHLGVPARHFAYPKGVLGGPAAEAAVRERFDTAALAVVGPNSYSGTDPYRLTRSPIQVSDQQQWFERKVSGGMAFEGRLRQLLNHRRYAGATT